MAFNSLMQQFSSSISLLYYTAMTAHQDTKSKIPPLTLGYQLLYLGERFIAEDSIGVAGLIQRLLVTNSMHERVIAQCTYLYLKKNESN